jgi:putative transposase
MRRIEPWSRHWSEAHGEELIRSIQQGLLSEGIMVSIAKLCAWFGVARRAVYYTPAKAAPKVDPRFADPIKALIEQEPSFGYRTVAWLLGFNKNTVQRIFQLKGWPIVGEMVHRTIS